MWVQGNLSKNYSYILRTFWLSFDNIQTCYNLHHVYKWHPHFIKLHLTILSEISIKVNSLLRATWFITNGLIKQLVQCLKIYIKIKAFTFHLIFYAYIVDTPDKTRYKNFGFNLDIEWIWENMQYQT